MYDDADRACFFLAFASHIEAEKAADAARSLLVAASSSAGYCGHNWWRVIERTKWRLPGHHSVPGGLEQADRSPGQ